MLAPTPTPTEQPIRLVTEAEAFGNLLLDMGVTLTARLDNQELLFQVGDDTPSGAIDVIRVISERFEADAEFREDMIGYLGAMGDYVCAAPGIDTSLAEASADVVIETVMKAGATPLLADYGQSLGLQLVFSHGEPDDRDLALCDLTRLLQRRFKAEPDFRAAVQQKLFGEGPHLTFIA